MDYYTAMEEAMVQAAEDSLQPTDLTRDQMIAQIDVISGLLMGSLPDWRRISLTADRQELRLRLLRAEQIAQRLLGGITYDFDCPKCGRLTIYQKGTPAGSIKCWACQ